MLLVLPAFLAAVPPALRAQGTLAGRDGTGSTLGSDGGSDGTGATLEVASSEIEAALREAGASPDDIDRILARLLPAEPAGSAQPGRIGKPGLITSDVAALAGATPGAVRLPARPEALTALLQERGVPERLLHPIIWLVTDRRYTRVDPEGLFRRLHGLGLATDEIRRISGRIRVYARERTEDAEAQYEFLSNTMYVPPDYLAPGSNPPRIKDDLSDSELNTLVHEFDHAEKDLLTDDDEMYGKGLGGRMLAGVRSLGKWGIVGGALSLVLATIPRVARALPLGKIGLGIVVGSAVLGAGYGLYRHFFSNNPNPRTPRQQRARDASVDIARVLRSRSDQRIHPGIPLTESRSKSWEVTGYFMGDSVTDMAFQIQAIQLHNHRRIRAAKTPEEVEKVLENLDLPPTIASYRFGDVERTGQSAWFRLEEVNFPYREHPELFQQIWKNSLGLQPPADAAELLERIRAAGEGQFTELRGRLREHADRRLEEIRNTPPPDDAPGFERIRDEDGI